MAEHKCYEVQILKVKPKYGLQHIAVFGEYNAFMDKVGSKVSREPGFFSHSSQNHLCRRWRWMVAQKLTRSANALEVNARDADSRTT